MSQAVEDKKISFPVHSVNLKGVWHEIFDFRFFSWINVPQAPKYSIEADLSFFENSRRYSRDTGDKLFSGVNYTGEKFITGVNDTGD